MRWAGRLSRILAGLLAAGVALFLLWAFAAGRPGAPLDLGDKPGPGTGRKLVALGQEFAHCRALLDRAGVRFEMLPPRRDGSHCGYADGVRFRPGGARRIAFTPANLVAACPVAAALAMWEWDAVQPAALRHFGQPVAAIEHLGSYNCRRMYGRSAGSWSEHATADAVDIAAFRLANGQRVSFLGDWRGDTAAAHFLHDVRDRACLLFATVLSPDYNAAHRDHLHFDQARRGAWGGRACR